MSRRYQEEPMSVTEATARYISRVKDWQEARSRREADMRAYMMISEDLESARRELVKAANKVLRRRKEHINASATFEDIAIRLELTVPFSIARTLGMDLEKSHYRNEDAGHWEPLDIPF